MCCIKLTVCKLKEVTFDLWFQTEHKPWAVGESPVLITIPHCRA